MRKLTWARVSYRIAFTLRLGHFISHYLKVHFMLIKYTCDSKSQTLRMRYLSQSTGRLISHRNGWKFCIYMIPLQNSHPGATTEVNLHWGDLCRHDILWWYNVNKCRAMGGSRSELTQVSCKHSLTAKANCATCWLTTPVPNEISTYG